MEVRRSESVIWRRVGDETVLLDTQTHRFANLNVTGTRLWESLDSPSSTEALAALLSREWELAQESAHSDVMAFCESLADRGLIKLTPRSAPAAG